MVVFIYLFIYKSFSPSVSLLSFLWHGGFLCTRLFMYAHTCMHYTVLYTTVMYVLRTKKTFFKCSKKDFCVPKYFCGLVYIPTKIFMQDKLLVCISTFAHTNHTLKLRAVYMATFVCRDI